MTVNSASPAPAASEQDQGQPTPRAVMQALPNVRMGATTVNGRLDPKRIQETVRAHYGDFRRCYEAGVKVNPELAGVVQTQFWIDGNGVVSHVSDKGSDLPDPEVVACIQKIFPEICFPRPEVGIVTVTYPIMFYPGNPP